MVKKHIKFNLSYSNLMNWKLRKPTKADKRHAANRHHCSFVMLNYETQLTRSNRKHIQAPLAAAIRSIYDLGVQLTASWNELYLGDSPPHRH